MLPNLSYIDEISDNDLDFKKKIIFIIKHEFPKEKEEFLLNYNSKNFFLASQNVHKLKHKINMFGLKKGCEIAVEFENELKKENISSYQDFIKVLEIINNYITNI